MLQGDFKVALHKMSSINAPYATLHDLPKYEKRADVVGAPWFKDQEAVKCSRGHDPIPYIACNSRTAPFATFHNIPETSEVQFSPSSSDSNYHFVIKIFDHFCTVVCVPNLGM